MGTDKNIKLHIVTDIKLKVNVCQHRPINQINTSIAKIDLHCTFLCTILLDTCLPGAYYPQ